MPSIADVVPDLPDGLAAIVDGCLRKRKLDRTARAIDVVAALTGLERARNLRRKRARTWIAVGGATSVLAVAGVVGWRLGRAEPRELAIVPAVGCGFTGPVAIDVITDRDTFVRALGEVRTVDFDDVDTRAGMVNIAPDRYAERGIVITSTDGQYVDDDFNYPTDFSAASPPNVFAAGPPAPVDSKVPAGGHDTELTFQATGRGACTSGVGMVFIDVDYTFHGPPTGLVVRDRRGHALGTALPETLHGADNSKQFRGVVTRDLVTGRPVPAIAAAHAVNGNTWIQIDAGEGVALDDIVFGVPTPAD